MTNTANPDDRPRQSMLSVPSNWSDLYFDIFAILCAFGEAFVICYVILRPPPSGDALEMAADILLRLAAVPVAAALQSFLIMKGRDLIMRTWERFAQERLERGRAEGMVEGLEKGRAEMLGAWTAWNARRVEAEKRGECFNEPPPSLNGR